MGDGPRDGPVACKSKDHACLAAKHRRGGRGGGARRASEVTSKKRDPPHFERAPPHKLCAFAGPLPSPRFCLPLSQRSGPGRTPRIASTPSTTSGTGRRRPTDAGSTGTTRYAPAARSLPRIPAARRQGNAWFPRTGRAGHAARPYAPRPRQVLPHWFESVTKQYPAVRFRPEEGDPHSPFFPLLGTYSSRNRTVLAQHFAWMKRAGIGVAVISWWGRPDVEGTRRPSRARPPSP